jgi:hypothetical protein
MQILSDRALRASKEATQSTSRMGSSFERWVMTLTLALLGILGAADTAYAQANPVSYPGQIAWDSSNGRVVETQPAVSSQQPLEYLWMYFYYNSSSVLVNGTIGSWSQTKTELEYSDYQSLNPPAVQFTRCVRVPGFAVLETNVVTVTPITCPTLTWTPGGSTLPTAYSGSYYETIIYFGSLGADLSAGTIQVTGLPSGMSFSGDANTGLTIAGTWFGTIPQNATVTITILDSACTHTKTYTLPSSPPVGTISGNAWLDTNCDGTRNLPQDAGLSGITVTLLDSSGNPVPGFSQVTGASGYYQFSNVELGDYQISFSLPSGYTFTTPGSSSSVNSSGIVTGITVAQGDWLSFNAGYCQIASCPSIAVIPASLPPPVVGVPYSQTITASNGAAPYTFSLTGSLPAGLVFNAGTGVISGTPLNNTPTSFTISASDANLCPGSVSHNLTPTCPTFGINPSLLATGNVGQFYSQQLSVNGINGAVTYSVSSGALPAGLTLNASTGLISGTPTSAANASFSITANVGGCIATRSFVIQIVACVPITISPSTLPNGSVGTPYSEQLTASGGNPAYTYAVTSGALPGGLNLDPFSGLISGMPTSSAAASFTITATDAKGCSSSQAYSIQPTPLANPCPAILITPASLPAFVVGQPYSVSLSASGGVAPYSWFVSSGMFPTAYLTLDPNTGVISGTIAELAAYMFTIGVKDANGCPATMDYEIIGGCPSLALSPASLPNATLGDGYSQTLTTSGGSGNYWYSVVGGTLPEGLSLNPSSGVISGSASYSGTFTFTIQSDDSNAKGCFTTRTYTIESICPSPVVISPSSLPAMTIGVPYSQAISVSGGGDNTYTLTLTSGSLPPNFSIGTNISGGFVINTGKGVVLDCGPYSFTLTATNKFGCSSF